MQEDSTPEARLQAAQQDIVRLCRYESRKHRDAATWMDHYYADALLSAWTAIRTYDPERGSLRAWIAYKVRMGFCDTRATYGPRVSKRSEAIYTGIVDDVAGQEPTPLPEKYYEPLTPLQRQVFYLVYDQGLSFSSCAAYLGISKDAVCSFFRRGKVRLRAWLESGELPENPGEYQWTRKMDRIVLTLEASEAARRLKVSTWAVHRRIRFLRRRRRRS